MGRRYKTRAWIDNSLGQYIALSVAAHLARGQLVPDPFKSDDSQHLGDTVDLVARALAKVIPLYVRHAKATEPRQLTALELEGAVVKRGGMNVALRDGRKLSIVSVKRADLRQAIAVLKATGIPRLPMPTPKESPPPVLEKPNTLAQLVELESLLSRPLIAPQVAKASMLATTIARQARQGRIANRAMQLVSALYETDDKSGDAEQLVSLGLARLRAAMEEAERSI